ncbi:MAG: DUF3788 family protein [Candidatus Limnocylindrales bacterium]|jgi:hypothetical protein
MTEPLFDPTVAPGPGAVDGLLGARRDSWHDLLREVEAMGALGSWVWGGPRYGWEWKARRAGKPFITLSPHAGGFKAMVILGPAASIAAASLPLGPRVRATFESAREFPDGRWLFQEVESARDVADLAALLRLKLPPSVRERPDGGR